MYVCMHLILKCNQSGKQTKQKIQTIDKLFFLIGSTKVVLDSF